MNIIKNKNFKNHKKILLLGAFVVCQIFAISFQALKPIQNKVFATQPPLTVNHNQVASKEKDLLKQVNDYCMAEIAYLYGITQERVAAVSAKLSTKDKSLIYAANQVDGNPHKFDQISANGIVNTQNKPENSYDMSINAPINGIEDYAASIIYSTVYGRILTQVLGAFFTYVKTNISHISSNNNIVAALGNLNNQIKKIKIQNSLYSKRLRSLAHVICLLTDFLGRHNNNLSADLRSYIAQNSDSPVSYSTWQQNFAGLPQNSSKQFGKDIKNYYDGLLQVLCVPSTNVADFKKRKNYILDIILSSVVPFQYSLAGQNNNALSDRDRDTIWKNIINRLPNSNLSKYVSAEGLDFLSKAFVGNPGANQHRLIKVENLINYGINRSLTIRRAYIGSFKYDVAGPAGSPVLTSITNQPLQVNEFNNTPIAQIPDNTLDLKTKRYPGPVPDEKVGNFLMKSVISMSCLSPASQGNINEINDSVLNSFFERSNRLEQAQKLHESLYTYSNYKVHVIVPNGAVAQPPISQAPNSDWYPMAFCQGCISFLPLLSNKLHVTFNHVPLKVDEIGKQNDAQSTWGKYRNLLNTYINTAASNIATAKAELTRALTPAQRDPGTPPQNPPGDTGNQHQTPEQILARALTDAYNNEPELVQKIVAVLSVFHGSDYQPNVKNTVKNSDLISQDIRNVLALFGGINRAQEEHRYSPEEFWNLSVDEQAILRAWASHIYNDANYPLPVPEAIKHGGWKTITPSDFRNLIADENAKRRIYRYLDSQPDAHKWFMHMAPFTTAIQPNDPLYTSSPAIAEHFIDLRQVEDYSDFCSRVTNAAQRANIISAYKHLANVNDEHLPVFLREVIQQPPSNNPIPDNVTFGGFWSNRYTDVQRESFRTGGNSIAEKYKRSQVEFIQRLDQNSPLAGVSLNHLDDASYYRSLSPAARRALHSGDPRPFYGEMFKYPPYSEIERDPELISVNLVDILTRGYNGNLALWNGLTDSQREKLKERNKLLCYPPFTQLEDMTDEAQNDIIYIGLLPDSNRERVERYIRDRERHFGDDDRFDYYRKRYDWYHGPSRDPKEYFKNEEKYENKDISAKSMVTDLASIVEISSVEALKHISLDTVKNLCTSIKNGEVDHYSKSNGKDNLSTDYFSSNTPWKKILFRCNTMISMYLGLLSIVENTNGLSREPNVKSLCQNLLTYLKGQIKESFPSDFYARNNREYPDRMCTFLDSVYSSVFGNASRRFEAEALIKSCGALFAVDPGVVDSILTQSKLDQSILQKLQQDMNNGRAAVDSFWDKMNDTLIKPADEVRWIRDLPASEGDYKSKQLRYLRSLSQNFRDSQVNLLERIYRLVNSLVGKKTSDEGKIYLNQINEDKKGVFNNPSDFIINVRNYSQNFYNILEKKKETYSERSYYYTDDDPSKFSFSRTNLRGQVFDILEKTFNMTGCLFTSMDKGEILRRNPKYKHSFMNYASEDLIKLLGSAREDYSKSQKELFLQLIGYVKTLKRFFEKEEWNWVQPEKIVEINSILNDIFIKSKDDFNKKYFFGGELDFVAYENDIARGNIPIPGIKSSRSYDFDYDYTYEYEDSSNKKDENPYKRIRNILQENEQTQLADLEKIGGTGVNTNLGRFSKDKYPKVDELMRMVFGYAARKHFLQYCIMRILKNCASIATYNISKGKSEEDLSLKDFGYKYDYDRSPEENFEDNLKVLLDRYASFYSKDHFAIEKGRDERSGPLREVKNALNSLIEITSNLGNSENNITNKLEELMAKQEEEKAKKEEEEDAEAADAESTDAESTDVDDADDEAVNAEDSQQKKAENPAEPEKKKDPVIDSRPEAMSVTTEATGYLFDECRAKYLNSKFTAKINPATGTIEGTIEYSPEEGYAGKPDPQFGNDYADICLVVFENNKIVMDRPDHQLFIKCHRAPDPTNPDGGLSKTKFFFSYTPQDPKALIELHAYDNSDKDDQKTRDLHCRKGHFHGSFAVGSWNLAQSSDSDSVLKTPEGPLDGNGSPLNNDAIKNIRYYKKPNGDLIVDLGPNADDALGKWIFCLILSNNEDGKALTNYQPTKYSAINRWYIQIPAKYASLTKELHAYRNIMDKNTFLYKIKLDVNSATSIAELKSNPVQSQPSAEPERKETPVLKQEAADVGRKEESEKIEAAPKEKKATSRKSGNEKNKSSKSKEESSKRSSSGKRTSNKKTLNEIQGDEIKSRTRSDEEVDESSPKVEDITV